MTTPDPNLWNIWYYTFSTSAQVIAALVGLFSVFVVYKIQEFAESLDNIRGVTIELITYLGANTLNYQAVQIQDTVSMSDSDLLKKFLELVTIKQLEPTRIKTDTTINIGTIRYTLNSQSYDLFNSLVSKKYQIFSELKNALIWSFCVIAFSVFALSTTSYILSERVLWVFLIFFMYTLFTIARGIYRIATR